ncbi:MAG: PIN domain-containing protein [Chloroflexales bacterium]|nr:PIN domain-containing protein [Chloroflexales bacterium]
MDTNVLLRFVDRNHPLHPIVRAAIQNTRRRGDWLCVTGQNFVEFWNVATRPVVRNGFGLSSADADRRLRLLERLFPILPEVPNIYPEWRRIVVAFGVAGVQVHDARLVAVMRAHGVSHILTFNDTDFARYVAEGIVATNPLHV